MKRCPTCSRVYDDIRLRFCLDDGTELVERPSPAPATVALPADERPQSTIAAFQPPPPPPYIPDEDRSRKRGRLALWILAIGLLVIIVTGAIIAARTLRKDG